MAEPGISRPKSLLWMIYTFLNYCMKYKPAKAWKLTKYVRLHKWIDQNKDRESFRHSGFCSLLDTRAPRYLPALGELKEYRLYLISYFPIFDSTMLYWFKPADWDVRSAFVAKIIECIKTEK